MSYKTCSIRHQGLKYICSFSIYSFCYRNHIKRRFMFQTARLRLATLQRHLMNNVRTEELSPTASSSSSSIHVSKEEALFDDPIEIQIRGLRPQQTVTFIATILDIGAFRSHNVFIARNDGTVDLTRDAPMKGTYTGVSTMGWLWSMRQSSTNFLGARLMTKDARKYREIQLDLFEGEVIPSGHSLPEPIHRKTIKRLYIGQGVRRVPVTEDGLRGTLFIPAGPGPFPAVLDMFGGLVNLNESRAAILSSHGYVTFALAYMMIDHLPKHFADLRIDYFVKAMEWFCRQSFVDDKRMAVIGLSFGGVLALNLATLFPKIRAVVNINGNEFCSVDMKYAWDHLYGESVAIHRVYHTNEGLVTKDIVQLEKDDLLPIWKYNTKVLILVSGDDMNASPITHFQFRDAWPKEKRGNLEMHYYPGAGHLIEPPYAPLYRGVSRREKPVVGSSDDAADAEQLIKGSLMVFGGYPKQHADAQEDAWKRILNFLQRALSTVH